MADTGIYDEADSYDGDGTSSYDLSYLLTRMALEGILSLPSYIRTRLLPAYNGSLPLPVYNSSRRLVAYSAIVSYPTYSTTLDLRLGD